MFTIIGEFFKCSALVLGGSFVIASILDFIPMRSSIKMFLALFSFCLLIGLAMEFENLLGWWSLMALLLIPGSYRMQHMFYNNVFRMRREMEELNQGIQLNENKKKEEK